MSPDIKRLLIWLGLRVLIASPAFSLAFYFIATAKGGFGAVPQLLLGFAFMIAGAFICAPGLAALIAEPAGRIFYPYRYLKQAGPQYSKAEALAAKKKYQEAAAYYENIIAVYPQELRAYIELMTLALEDLEDHNLARRIFEQGQTDLNSDDQREALGRTYDALREWEGQREAKKDKIAKIQPELNVEEADEEDLL